MEEADNVVLLTVDCLRPDHLPTYGYDRETAPFIERIGSESLIFENAFATGPGTSVSFPSILTGTYPFDYGGYNGLSSQRTPLAEVLKKEDIATAGIHSNTFLTEHYGYDRGFDKYESFSDEASGGRVGRKVKRALPDGVFRVLRSVIWKYRVLADKQLSVPYVPADKTTDRAINWLDELEEPFFLWVHYLDPHEPHRPPETIHSEFSKEEPNWQSLNVDWRRAKKTDYKPDERRLRQFIDAYDAEIKFVDENIERLYDALERNGFDDNTLKLITADHGEEFMDHGNISHTPQLYDELIHVPLIIDSPDNVAPARIEQIVSLIDIPSTVLRAFDIELPDSFRGYPLQTVLTTTDTNRQHIIAEVCHEWGDGIDVGDFHREKIIVTCRTRQYKYILNNQLGTEEFYNNRLDPEEVSESTSVPKQKREFLRTKVREHLVELHDSDPGEFSRETPDDVQERMRDLGYIE